MGLLFPLLAASFIAVGVWLLYDALVRGSKGWVLPLPPGPRGSLVIGNWQLLRGGKLDELFMQWGGEYESDVVHTRVLGQHVICLNSAQAATDLIDKRSLNYGDRPRFRLFEVMGWAPTLTFLSSSSPQFKLHRSLFQTSFSNASIRSYQPIQMDEAKQAVKGVIERPGEWEDVTLEMSTGIIWRVAFGKGFRSLGGSGEYKRGGNGPGSSLELGQQEGGNRFLQLAKQAAEATTTGGFPGLNLVDLVPGIQCLPDAIARRLVPELAHARQSRHVIENMTNEPWQAARCEMEKQETNKGNGTTTTTTTTMTTKNSFVGRLYSRMIVESESGGGGDSKKVDAGRNPVARAMLTEGELKGAAAAVLVAGGSTTWSTVCACFLFLTLFPDVQDKIQKELDACLHQGGRPRLPTFDDLPRLPYLCGFVHEVLRLLPLNPVIIPHANTAGDEYKGYRIPARSIILVNAKAINLDPSTYSNPHLFEPERFMSTKDGGREEPPPLGNFGFGRRKCPGRELALQGVRVCLAVMLGVLDVKGDHTRPNKVDVCLGLGGHPGPFQAHLSVRRPDMAELLLDDLDRQHTNS
ncbi:cytochrome p450 [Zalerion maritima]|uniref:Cytochrome p450 n=1 Tax=Zalerion maritima TaxID=339359 RepID=A0AAD5RV75_9PEZI|nr:cytochrome p450 [Zalerion maritima]